MARVVGPQDSSLPKNLIRSGLNQDATNSILTGAEERATQKLHLRFIEGSGALLLKANAYRSSLTLGWALGLGTKESPMPEETMKGPKVTLDTILGHITMEMTSSLNLREVLNVITQGLVDDLDAAFARIWLVGPGDLCTECYKATDCANRERCLHLEASAGMYTNLNGEYRRIPLGALKIGRIAQGEGRTCTNDVLNDERLPNKQWLRENRLQSFCGYPLVFRG